MTDSPDRHGFSSMHMRAGESTGTRLAHWPPPQRGKESKPVLARHETGDAGTRVKPRRGWRLTRAIFSEFADEE